MIAPKPFKYRCKNCNYSRVVKQKSDLANIKDLIPICPKCGTVMERIKLNLLEKF